MAREGVGVAEIFRRAGGVYRERMADRRAAGPFRQRTVEGIDANQGRSVAARPRTRVSQAKRRASARGMQTSDCQLREAPSFNLRQVSPDFALAGRVILQWCWAHQRRSFIDCSAGRVRLRRWCQRWIERIAEIYRLNDARLEHYDPAQPLERQSPAFDAAHARLKDAVDELFAAAEAELAGLTDRARRARPLRSLLNHREGLCVFVDRPFVPMDNNRGELFLRAAVIGRRLSFGSDSEKGAGFTATMYSVAGTLAINGIDVRRWLREWLTACAENGRKPPEDLSPWLPWSMSGERRRELAASG